MGVVAVYHHLGGRAARGSNLVIEEVHEPLDGVPTRMAPLVFAAATVNHLFGAAVGREGAAVQMSASLADTSARLLRIGGRRRQELLVAAIAAGFGSLFGMPIAGAVWALEVQTVGRIRYEAVLAAFTGSLVGARVVTALGLHHPLLPTVELDVDVWEAVRIGVAGIAFGICASLFVWTTHRVKDVLRPVSYPPLRAGIAGVAVVLGTLLVGRDYLSLSMSLGDAAVAGASVAALAWLGKLLFTAVCLGAGMPGGEVAPLFVIGSTLGSTLADPLDLPRQALAGVGFVAVLAGAANTPIACTILAAELFGGGLLVPAAIACAVAFVFSGHVGIYSSQVIEIRKRN
jgi:H+/Cl- antiporter ClcA